MILLLGPQSPLVEFLSDQEATVVTAEPMDLPFIERHRPDFIVSYNYRHRISREIIDWMRGRAINLHISLLPYNRGAHPNFWSWVDNTPKGVTIHRIDDGWDTGEILVQRTVDLDGEETFRETYWRLQKTIQALFGEYWPALRSGDIRGYTQSFKTAAHQQKDLEAYWPLLVNGWDTPITKALDAIHGTDRNIEQTDNFCKATGFRK